MLPKVVGKLAALNLKLFKYNMPALEVVDAFEINLPILNCDERGVLLPAEAQLYFFPFAFAIRDGLLDIARAMYPYVADKYYMDNTGMCALSYVCQVVTKRPGNILIKI